MAVMASVLHMTIGSSPLMVDELSWKVHPPSGTLTDLVY
jgi:hypothetical protein